MKRIGFAVLLGSLLALSTHSGETDLKPPDGDAKFVDAKEFFRFGELYAAHSWAVYYESIATKLDERWDMYLSQAKKIGAPKEVQDALQEYRAKMATLPLDKPWAEWSEPDHKKWPAIYPPSKLIHEWLNKPDYQEMFFYYLGRTCLLGHYVLNKYVLEQNYPIDSYKADIKNIINDADLYMSDKGYETARKRLSPDGLQALKDLRAFKGKVDDPFGDPISRDDVTRICQLCKTISTLARENKLTNDAPK